MDDETLQRLYTWVDEIPLSRPKRNISRDFSDGVLVAEVVAHYAPRVVELHNYSAANAMSQKMYNWTTLNSKVFRKLGFQIPKILMEKVARCRQGAVEEVLVILQKKLANIGHSSPKRTSGNDGPSNGGGGGSHSRRHAKGNSPTRVARGPGGVRPQRDVVREEKRNRGPIDAPFMSEEKYEYAPAAREGGSEHHHEGGGGGGGIVIELKETIEIMDLKIKKLEQLVRLKDEKIMKLQARLASGGGSESLYPESREYFGGAGY